MLLDILSNLRMNHTSQEVSMVHHVTWLPWLKSSRFGIRIWLSTCIPYTDMQSKMARNSVTTTKWANSF